MRRRRRAREGHEKRENRRPILKKLCAALLRSFRGQHSEKMKGSARGNWEPREGQQPFRPNPNGAGDRITMLRRLLIGAVLIARALLVLIARELHRTTNFVTNCVYHNIMVFLYVFWGADFKNGMKNFVMSVILPLFKIL